MKHETLASKYQHKKPVGYHAAFPFFEVMEVECGIDDYLITRQITHNAKSTEPKVTYHRNKVYTDAFSGTQYIKKAGYCIYMSDIFRID